jgi:hypothetical protein
LRCFGLGSGFLVGFLDLAGMPGLVPADELLSFASPKESIQRKGDPAKRPTGSRKRMDSSGKRNQLATLKHVSLLYPLESILLRRFAKGLASKATSKATT